MVLAPSIKMVLGCLAFGIFWVLAVFPAVPFMPIGRTAGSLLGGMLMVLFQVITPDQAFEAIDLPILGLLFGTMVVSVYLERADMFKYLGKLLSWKSQGAKDLLCRICLISAISSAFFTNDTSCVVLTEFVLKIARQQNLPPHPFLLALASSANIGSAATPIGNPQNLVIAVQSQIPFGQFLFGIASAMVVGICVNAFILLCMFWKLLSVHKDEEEPPVEVTPEEDVNSHRFSPATMSHLSSHNSSEFNAHLESSPSVVNGHADHFTLRNRGPSEIIRDENGSNDVAADGGSSQRKDERLVSRVSSTNGFIMTRSPDLGLEEIDDKSAKWKIILWKVGVYAITLGMLISFLVGLNMSWTAITAALALIILDFKDARPCLEKVSYSLLVFFCGMFVTVEGFNKTGLPSAVWDFMEPYARIDHISGVAILAAVILVLSNLASNVPTGILSFHVRTLPLEDTHKPLKPTNRTPKTTILGVIQFGSQFETNFSCLFALISLANIVYSPFYVSTSLPLSLLLVTFLCYMDYYTIVYYTRDVKKVFSRAKSLSGSRLYHLGWRIAGLSLSHPSQNLQIVMSEILLCKFIWFTV